MKRILEVWMSLALVLSLAACGVDGKSTPAPSTNQAAPVATPDETQVPVTTPTPEPVNEMLAIGDSADLGDWNISVTAFEWATRIDDGYGYFSPDEGNQYAVVSVSITNNGKQADTFLPSFGMSDDISVKVYYDGDYEYSATQLLGYSNDLYDSSLNPLTSKSGNIVFSVPDAVANGDESLVVTFIMGSNNITFTLR